jgi:hypothetical protein
MIQHREAEACHVNTALRRKRRAKPPAVTLPAVSPELAALFDRYAEAAAACSKANSDADTLEFAIRRGESYAIARQHELPDLRRIEQEAVEHREEAENRIVAFEPRTIADAFAKIYFGAEEEYIVPRVLHRDAYPTSAKEQQDCVDLTISTGLLAMARLLVAHQHDEPFAPAMAAE